MFASCPGHNEYDVIEWTNFINRGETYTNDDFFRFIHPWNEELPYVFDSYDFQYCVNEGYDEFTLYGQHIVYKGYKNSKKKEYDNQLLESRL